jgi:hypothetical protein
MDYTHKEVESFVLNTVSKVTECDGIQDRLEVNSNQRSLHERIYTGQILTTVLIEDN